MANLEGMKMKFTVIKNEDRELFLSTEDAEKLKEIQKEIAIGRELNGKKSDHTYLVINTDEDYADEVIDILKRNGHWS